MKKIILAAVLAAGCVESFSQSSIYISAGAYVIVTAGTTLAVDSLVLKPAANFTITGANSVTQDANATPVPPSAYIQRVYHFLQTTSPFSGDVTVYYRDAELNGLTENTLNLSAYNCTAWTAYTPSQRDAVNNFVTSTGLAAVNLNQVTLTAPGSALPVTLTNLRAYQQKSGVQVEWRAQQEINIAKYEVEQSQNSLQFLQIGTVAAIGNSNAVINYSFFDAKPYSGVNYYRIKIIENNGTAKYSSVAKVNFSSKKLFMTVFPNPVTGNTIGLQLNNLPKGMYNLSVSNKAGQTIATKQITITCSSFSWD